MYNQKYVNANLKILRKANKMSQLDVASYLGFSASNISLAERNMYQHNPANLLKLSVLFETTVEAFSNKPIQQSLEDIDAAFEKKDRARKDRINFMARKRRAANPELYRMRDRAQYNNSPEARKARADHQRARYKSDPEFRKAKARLAAEWRNSNKERVKAHNADCRSNK